MAADSRDPITGAYIFSDMGASDIGVDPTLVSAQAVDVGTRIIRDNLAALEADEDYGREGLLGVALDTGIEYRHNGSGWAVLFRPLSTYTTTVAGLNAAQVTTVSKYEQRGKFIKGEVLITRTVAGLPTTNVSITLPTTPANTSASRNLGAANLYLENNSTVYPGQSRYTGSNAVNINLSAIVGAAVAQGTNVNASFPTASAHAVGTVYHVTFEYETA